MGNLPKGSATTVPPPYPHCNFLDRTLFVTCGTKVTGMTVGDGPHLQ